MLIDSHCHLDGAAWPEGPDAVLARARVAGVSGFVVIGVGGARESHDAVALATRHADVRAVVGVHPHDASSAEVTWAGIDSLLATPDVVAVGEIGLDYHYDHSPREVQLHVFRDGIARARRARLPIVVHTREAAADTLAVLRDEGAREVGGVIHCFSEDRAFARDALGLGFYLSFSGIVTFRSARAVQEVAAWAPLERVLVETDSPYLAPVPVRGSKCEPAFVLHTARRVAALRGMDFEALAAATTANAGLLFRLANAEPRRLGPAV